MTPTTSEREALVADLETVWHSVSDDADTNAAYQRLKAALTREQRESGQVLAKALYDPESGRAATVEHFDWPNSGGFVNVLLVRASEQPQQEAPGAVATEADTFAALAKALIPFMRTSASVADAVRSVLHVLPTHPAPSDAVVEALRKLVAAAAWSATTNTPFAHNSAAVAEAKAALATRCPVVVDEDAREAIDAILSRLEGWAKAYPVDIFHEPTQEERDWLHATKPGLMDCISASMGRHMAKCVAEDLAALRAALEVPNG